MRNKILALLGLLVPALAPAREVTGEASWYGIDYDGKIMADGDPFDYRYPTLATYEFPLGTSVLITYRSKSGQIRKAHALVTDRGPSIDLRNKGRKFDLSWSLFKTLESPKFGVINVTVTEVK